VPGTCTDSACAGVVMSDENLLNRRMAKALSMMKLPPRDDENVCTLCGVPDVHCQCEAEAESS
jgi:hypothetical protein